MQIFVLATVQGITEFLPISSQAHLILVDDLANWPDAGLRIHVAVHVGSLGAVFLYFRSDVWAALKGVFNLILARNTENARLAFHLAVGSAPVIAAGATVVMLDLQEWLASPALIAWTMIGFGLLLWLADRIGMTVRRIEHMRSGAAIAIGVAQTLALVPGTSRAGITMTAARMLGYERTEASRFAMLLGIPVILAAGSWDGYTIWKNGDVQLGFDAILAVVIAFATSYASVTFLMAWLKRATFTPFVLYRVVVGGVLLYAIYFA